MFKVDCALPAYTNLLLFLFHAPLAFLKSFGILLKSMNVGQDVTTFTDVIVNDLYKMYTKMTVKCFKGPYF